jgi:hypothetical protein
MTMTQAMKVRRDELNTAILTIYETETILELVGQSLLDKVELETLQPADCVRAAKGMDACVRLLKLVTASLDDIESEVFRRVR